MMSSCALKVVDSVAKQFIHRFDLNAWRHSCWGQRQRRRVTNEHAYL